MRWLRELFTEPMGDNLPWSVLMLLTLVVASLAAMNLLVHGIGRRRRHRYIGIIVGKHSGHETPLTFITFRRKADAEKWAERMNDRIGGRGEECGTRYEYRERERA